MAGCSRIHTARCLRQQRSSRNIGIAGAQLKPPTHAEESFAWGDDYTVPEAVKHGNVWLRCAVLEEKLQRSSARARQAETTVKALTEEIRRMRQGKASAALKSERELYDRVEASLRAVQEVAEPMKKSERDAVKRHETVVGELTQIDVKVRLELARLRQQVKSLGNENSKLRAKL